MLPGPRSFRGKARCCDEEGRDEGCCPGVRLGARVGSVGRQKELVAGEAGHCVGAGGRLGCAADDFRASAGGDQRDGRVAGGKIHVRAEGTDPITGDARERSAASAGQAQQQQDRRPDSAFAHFHVRGFSPPAELKVACGLRRAPCSGRAWVAGRLPRACGRGPGGGRSSRVQASAPCRVGLPVGRRSAKQAPPLHLVRARPAP